jgi:predicted Fe-Mo cluster-binding NifX family protein
VLKANSSEDNAKQQELSNMRIAVPLAGDKLAEHFGHCDTFALIDVDSEKKELVARLNVDAPPHQPGLLPGWLAEKGAEVVIAGGMGQRASDLLSEQGIRVVLGAERDTAENIVMAFLSDNLKLSANRCDH